MTVLKEFSMPAQ